MCIRGGKDGEKLSHIFVLHGLVCYNHYFLSLGVSCLRESQKPNHKRQAQADRMNGINFINITHTRQAATLPPLHDSIQT